MMVGRRFDVKHFLCILCFILHHNVQSFTVYSPFRLSREASLVTTFKSNNAAGAGEEEKTDSSCYQANITTVRETPCVRICRYNADFFGGAVCIGCFREAFEIGNWASFSSQERLYALQDEAMVAFYRAQK